MGFLPDDVRVQGFRNSFIMYSLPGHAQAILQVPLLTQAALTFEYKEEWLEDLQANECALYIDERGHVACIWEMAVRLCIIRSDGRILVHIGRLDDESMEPA